MRQPKHAAEPIPERFVPTLRRGPFGATPAGKKLLKVFEKGCDEAELEKGRRLARRGVVTRFQLRPGMLSCELEGEANGTVRVAIRTTLLSAEFRRAFLERVDAASGTAGEFLNRRISKCLLADIGEERLVPSVPEIEVQCSECGEQAGCRHAIAAKSLLVDFLNEDALLLLRWRGFGEFSEDDLGDWPPNTEAIVDLLREVRGWTRPVSGVAIKNLEWNKMSAVPPLPEAPDPEETSIVEQLGVPPFFSDSERNLQATLRRLQEDA